MSDGQPQFRFGFKEYAQAHPGVVGEPLTDEAYDPWGNSEQWTTRGRLVWVKAVNRVYFFQAVAA